MELDHIAIAGETLEAATAYVEDTLGVPLQAGGQHVVFATHNRLLGLGDGLYLEAIAIDPVAEPPQRPRWFDLDRLSGPPRLCNWICRSSDLPQSLSRAPAGTGAPVALTRGDLRWDMAVPESGILPFDNCFPAVMQWHSPHPATKLTQQGCRLKALTLSHPKHDELERAVAATGLGPATSSATIRFEAGPPALWAEIETPHGLRVLSSSDQASSRE